jgi:hypothetical protein
MICFANLQVASQLAHLLKSVPTCSAWLSRRPFIIPLPSAQKEFLSHSNFHSSVNGFLFAYFFFFPKEKVSGGDEEDRTPDPLRARQVLSQLSYTPIL